MKTKILYMIKLFLMIKQKLETNGKGYIICMEKEYPGPANQKVKSWSKPLR